MADDTEGVERMIGKEGGLGHRFSYLIFRGLLVQASPGLRSHRLRFTISFFVCSVQIV